MTAREAAKYFGVSTRTIYRRIRKGQIKAKKVNRKWVIDLNPPEAQRKPAGNPKKPAEWNPQVHESAKRDGHRPSDFNFEDYPISNIELSMLTLHEGQWPHYTCEISRSVPIANLYADDGRPLPDPKGIALSRVKFQLWDAETNKRLDEVNALPGSDGNIETRASSRRGRKNRLWKTLTPGKTIKVYLTAFPLFDFLNEAGGSAGGAYANGNNGYFRGNTLQTEVQTWSKDEDGNLSRK